jgi:hypothetical protein
MNFFLPNLGAGYWLLRYTQMAGKATSVEHTVQRVSIDRPQNTAHLRVIHRVLTQEMIVIRASLGKLTFPK